jgi:hypothetical protein
MKTSDRISRIAERAEASGLGLAYQHQPRIEDLQLKPRPEEIYGLLTQKRVQLRPREDPKHLLLRLLDIPMPPALWCRSPSKVPAKIVPQYPPG